MKLTLVMWCICSLILRPSHCPFFDRLQYAKKKKNWTVGRPGNDASYSVLVHVWPHSHADPWNVTVGTVDMAPFLQCMHNVVYFTIN